MLTSPAVTEKASEPSPRSRRVGLISLGCAKNLLDAEIMLGTLIRQGLEIVNDPTCADAVIVNTCSFIDAAQEESVDTILESAAVREANNRGQALIVSGCLPQRFAEDLPRLLPEVDAFIGIDQVEEVGQRIEEAITRRAGRRGARSNPGPSKSEVSARLSELERDGDPARELSTGNGREKGPSAPVMAIHQRPQYLPRWDTPRYRLTPAHFAYVKIAEGCNHPCSFCIIPRMRGSHRSRRPDDVVEEARRLIAEGVRELNLISQDTTYYGLDLRPNASRAIASPERFAAAAGALPASAPSLPALVRQLNALPGEFWIRLLYTHPAHWTSDLIRTIADCPKVARYVDMPLQHIHDDLLARMRRETDGRFIRDLIGRIRDGIPGIALRTTFIVGFPGETDEHFETLLEFIRQTRFERMGVFTYSKEDGTVAGRMAGQVPDGIKRARRNRAMAEQLQIAREISASFVGRRLKVLIEGEASRKQLRQANVFSWEHGMLREAGARDTGGAPGKVLIARGEADAPDIDGRVYIQGRAPVGQFAAVEVIGHTDYDLVARPT